MNMDYGILYKKIKDTIRALPERYQKVLSLRYGMEGEPKTLEHIGDKFNVTRERIRQIEVKALSDLRKEQADELAPCFAWIQELIIEEGGIVPEPDFLLRRGKERQGALHLILYLGDQFFRGTGNDEIHHHWYLEEGIRERALSELTALMDYLTTKNSLMKKEEIESRLSHPNFLKISKVIGLSPLGMYGFTHWPEVVPKGVKDKAYIVLKKARQPLHFTEITKRINALGLGKRPALKQTVHNELIKDRRFILVGRGLYALSEWGFKAGTVKDILNTIFRETTVPLSKEDVINRVLRERFVQKNTILLNLNNGHDFKRLRDGRYALKTQSAKVRA